MNEEDILFLGNYQATEDYRYIQLGQQMTKQQGEARALITEFRGLFVDMPATTDLECHHIVLTSNLTIRCKPYIIPYNMREALQRDIEDMLRMKVITESNSPYAFPVVKVRKKMVATGCA